MPKNSKYCLIFWEYVFEKNVSQNLLKIVFWEVVAFCFAKYVYDKNNIHQKIVSHLGNISFHKNVSNMHIRLNKRKQISNKPEYFWKYFQI